LVNASLKLDSNLVMHFLCIFLENIAEENMMLLIIFEVLRLKLLGLCISLD